MKIAILGAGSWGTTLAALLSSKFKDVHLWVREKEIVESIAKKRENPIYLPGIELPASLIAEQNLDTAVQGAELIITAIPSQYLRSVLQSIKEKPADCTVVNVAKGLEINTFKRMSQVIEEELPGVKVAVISGPNHAEEVSQKIATGTVIASQNADLEKLKEIFETPYFKVYPHDDIIGVEICGSVKNIIALATGVISSLGLGDNATGSIITFGLREMTILGKHFGAQQKTCYGLAGVGDLVATCTSIKSRNRKAGQLLAKGMNFEQIKKEMHGMVAEGVTTCKAVHEYAVKNNLDLPLTSQTYKVLFEDKELHHAIEDLKKLI